MEIEEKKSLVEGRLAKATEKILQDSVKGSVFLRRRIARLAIVQFIYQVEIAGVPPKELLDSFRTQDLGFVVATDEILEGETFPEPDEQWLDMLLQTYVHHQESIRDLIRTAVERGGRSFWRLEPLLSSIMLAATCEIVVSEDLSTAVILNEYLELTRDFYSGNEYRIVNGVLDNIAKKILS